MPAHLTPEVEENLTKKLLYHFEERPEVDEGQLKISLFTDREEVSYKLWRDMFNADLYYVNRYPLIPVPRDCIPDHYDEFVDLVSDYIQNFLNTRQDCNSCWGILDFGTKDHPRLHLVITNRYLKNEEFGKWLTAEVGRKHIIKRTDMKHRKRRVLQHRVEPQTAVESPPAAAPADPRPLSSGGGGQVPGGPTERETVSPVSDDKSRRESEASSCEDFTTEGSSSESGLEQVPLSSMLLFTARRRVFEALGESVEEISESSPVSPCGIGCFGSCLR